MISIDKQIPCSRCKYKILLKYSSTVLESKAAVDKLCSHCRKNILLKCHETARDIITLHDRIQFERERIPDKKNKWTHSQIIPFTTSQIRSKTIKRTLSPPCINKFKEFPSLISLDHEPENKRKDLFYQSTIKEKKQQFSSNRIEDNQPIRTDNLSVSISTLDTLRMQGEIIKATKSFSKSKDGDDKQSEIGSSKSENLYSRDTKKSDRYQKHKNVNDNKGMEKLISGLDIKIQKKISSKSDYLTNKHLFRSVSSYEKSNDDFSYHFLQKGQDGSIPLKNRKSSLEILDEMRKRKDILYQKFVQKKQLVQSKEKKAATDDEQDAILEFGGDKLINEETKNFDKKETTKENKLKQKDDTNNSFEVKNRKSSLEILDEMRERKDILDRKFVQKKQLVQSKEKKAATDDEQGAIIESSGDKLINEETKNLDKKETTKENKLKQKDDTNNSFEVLKTTKNKLGVKKKIKLFEEGDKRSEIGSSKSENLHSRDTKKSDRYQKHMNVNDNKDMEKLISDLDIKIQKKISSKSDYLLDKHLFRSVSSYEKSNDDFSYHSLQKGQDESIPLKNRKSSLEILDEMRERKDILDRKFAQKKQLVQSKEKKAATDDEQGAIIESSGDKLINEETKNLDKKETTKENKLKQKDDTNNSFEVLKTTKNKLGVKKKIKLFEEGDKRSEIGSSKSENLHSRDTKKSDRYQKHMNVNDNKDMEKLISDLDIKIQKKISSKSDYLLDKHLFRSVSSYEKSNDDFSYHSLQKGQDESIPLKNRKSSLEILDEMRERKDILDRKFAQKKQLVQSKEKKAATDDEQGAIIESSGDKLINEETKNLDKRETTKENKLKQKDDTNNSFEVLKTTKNKLGVKKKIKLIEEGDKSKSILNDRKHTNVDIDAKLKIHTKEDTNAQFKLQTKINNDAELKKHTKVDNDAQLKHYKNQNSKIVDNKEMQETKLNQSQEKELKTQQGLEEKKDKKTKNQQLGTIENKYRKQRVIDENSEDNSLQTESYKKQGKLTDTDQKNIINEEFQKKKKNKENMEKTEKIQKQKDIETSSRERQVKEVPSDNQQLLKSDRSKLQTPKPGPKEPKGIIRYSLSDRTFIDKGWTKLPTEKVVRKLNVYRMRPAHPEFNWFENNKNKTIRYDTGEKFAQIEDSGRGQWFYRNGKLALDYYEPEELNSQQRIVVYSNGEPDEHGRSRPLTILATFDYLGNGVVFDHAGKIRLKYNQTEGVLLDRSIGPVSHWKWHTLNDPPVLQQVMIETQMENKDPDIMKLDSDHKDAKKEDNEDMLAIEYENFIKEKSKRLTQRFKPFQIKMKALKINENFSLKILDQATCYLIFRDGSTNLKLNIGMILDNKEIIDTDLADVGEISNSIERYPAKTDSLAAMQRSIKHAQRVQQATIERARRFINPSATYEKINAAISKPLRHHIQDSRSAADTMCRCRYTKLCCNLYYDTSLI